MRTPMFEISEARDLFQAVGVKGFTMRFRLEPKSVAGGTWIAQVSRRGEYIRAQNVNPIKALEALKARLTAAQWRSWGHRPWKDKEVHL